MENLIKKSKTCARLINGNKQCKCKVMKNSEFCYWHNPEIPENEKQETRSKGGKSPKRMKTVFGYVNKINITSDEDIPNVIVDIMNEYRAGIIPEKTAIVLGNLCGVLVKAYQNKNSKLIEEIQERLNEADKVNQYRNAG